MEVALFLVIGVIAVMSAMSMLLTEKAVHSALFLIVNFLCVAVLYIMLDAPFLAMIQIAVYAGAIMVLFLFVIMLLNADELGAEEISLNYRGVSFFSLVLAVVFVLVMAFAFLEGDIDNQAVAEAQPTVRVLNFAPDLVASDFYINDTLVLADSEFSINVDALVDIEFVPVDEGEVTFGFSFAGDDPEVIPPEALGTLTLEPDHDYSLILYGEGGLNPQFTLVETDLSEPRNNDLGRVVVFNAMNSLDTVDVAVIGSDFRFDSDELNPPDYAVTGLTTGSASDALELGKGNPHWAVVQSDITPAQSEDSQDSYDLTTVTVLREYEIAAGTSEMLVLAERHITADDSIQYVALPIGVRSEFNFGSPEAIGESLFIQYVLPFEIVAVLLLAAMVGAIVLAQRVDVKPKPGRAIRRKVSRPLTAVIASQTGSNVMQSVPELNTPPAEAGDDDDDAQADPASD